MLSRQRNRHSGIAAKYSEIIFRERRGACTIEEVEAIVGGEQVLVLMRRAGLLAPAIASKRLTRFEISTLWCP